MTVVVASSRYLLCIAATYTSVSSTTSGNVTKTVSAGVTYYFAAKDSAGNVSIDESLELYAEGTKLIKMCSEKIKNVSLKIEEIDSEV